MIGPDDLRLAIKAVLLARNVTSPIDDSQISKASIYRALFTLTKEYKLVPNVCRIIDCICGGSLFNNWKEIIVQIRNGILPESVFLSRMLSIWLSKTKIKNVNRRALKLPFLKWRRYQFRC